MTKFVAKNWLWLGVFLTSGIPAQQLPSLFLLQ
jgi:hypothetical protein